MPLISVILVCKNSENLIANAISSVLHQKFENLELIIQDSVSSDKTVEEIKKFDDKRIKFVSERDTGIYDGLNKAIKRSSGEVVGIMHSDDIYDSQDVLLQVWSAFEREKVDLVYGDLKYTTAKGHVIRNWTAGNFSAVGCKLGWMPPHPAVFYRRSSLLRYGLFDLSFSISSDYEMMMRLFYKEKVRNFYLPICITRMRIGGVSNQIGNLLRKLLEDIQVMRLHRMPWIITILSKNLRKLQQFM
jgi:glycosyltransferase